MNNLSQECIETIYNQIDESVSGRNDIILGCKEALTNPTIYQAAGLMTVEEAFNFFCWVVNTDWRMYGNNTWFRYQSEAITTTELLNIFRNKNK